MVTVKFWDVNKFNCHVNDSEMKFDSLDEAMKSLRKAGYRSCGCLDMWAGEYKGTNSCIKYCEAIIFEID